MPTADTGEISVVPTLDSGLSDEAATKVTKQIEAIIHTYPEVALFLTNDDFGMMANIGVIMLMGLVTKNAILLVDFAKQQRAQGVERNEALLIAGRTRLRPIVMTSVAMIFGMMPLALGLGQGAESRAPMAHAIIGGVISSTLLTLVVVPLMYSFLDDLRRKFRPNASINASGKKVLGL